MYVQSYQRTKKIKNEIGVISYLLTSDRKVVIKMH